MTIVFCWCHHFCSISHPITFHLRYSLGPHFVCSCTLIRRHCYWFALLSLWTFLSDFMRLSLFYITFFFNLVYSFYVSYLLLLNLFHVHPHFVSSCLLFIIHCNLILWRFAAHVCLLSVFDPNRSTKVLQSLLNYFLLRVHSFKVHMLHFRICPNGHRISVCISPKDRCLGFFYHHFPLLLHLLVSPRSFNYFLH